MQNEMYYEWCEWNPDSSCTYVGGELVWTCEEDEDEDMDEDADEDMLRFSMFETRDEKSVPQTNKDSGCGTISYWLYPLVWTAGLLITILI